MNKREIVVYISGPYSGKISENIQKARTVAIQVWEAGYMVFCPHLNTIHFENDCKCVYEDYLAGDIEIINRCNAVLMVEGWEGSNGATQEYNYAKAYGLPIFYSLAEMEDYYASTHRD